MEKLVKGLHEFQTNYFSRHQELFSRLSGEQHPRVLFITCCDSRINPHLMTQTEPGEIFIMRNIGNIIPPYGTINSSEAAAIDYAIRALEIQNIVLCGHSDCGAIKGLLKLSKLAEEMPSVYQWLQYAEATRQVVKENYPLHTGDSLMNITIQENVLTQIENLRTYPSVRAKLTAGKLHIHGWVYQIHTGEVFAYCPVEGQFVKLTAENFPSFDCGHADLTVEPTASSTVIPELLTPDLSADFLVGR
jgi:carbonic anhydrase